LLVALPGQVHLAVWLAEAQPGLEPGLLTWGEVFDAVSQQSADPVQRVVFVSAPGLPLVEIPQSC
jgi:hypothetical protein